MNFENIYIDLQTGRITVIDFGEAVFGDPEQLTLLTIKNSKRFE